ncbi:hypothetical protein [Dickeya fangzhongdai]|uniref:Uncharacterized protein n=1 Tax=Dickeya fangzhongdai TaxID=1778540 RepID=A0A2K8QPM2_9GAMM|nr:hypothetical protein [Dickeya fangzhongdai]ATZ95312.1 hypothetical protein CVE23_15795 [Dickeya fangzhongdai]QOH48753.1 hypothetical protein DYD82_15860 [Dickeya fangzhongdai]QOH53057.1 hypothetical protein DYD83_15860 [Dickeya fangzhongdai]WOX99954.1 hypothetical protein OGM22_20515 [Dickeya fangzhongdai]WOY04897.1 hypothetical protein OGM21_01910 [Dickeya fangzhongdai]
MNAYQLYDAAMENAENNDIEISAEYFSDYAEGALNIFMSQNLAEKIYACAVNFRDNGVGTNDLWHMVEKPLSEIEI